MAKFQQKDENRIKLKRKITIKNNFFKLLRIIEFVALFYVVYKVSGG